LQIVKEFDTVLVAIGRTANTKSLNLDSLGVKLNKKNGKIIGGFDSEIEKTHVQNIFALGDCLDGVPE
jgi:thioredoxin reductase (NADPH)